MIDKRIIEYVALLIVIVAGILLILRIAGVI